MSLVDLSIKKPVIVVVGIALFILFGLLSLWQLPSQLTPNVIEPEISIRTTWPGATPSEIERDIIEKQEEYLKSTPGLLRYESLSADNMAEITLTFAIETDIDKALLEVSNKINQVDFYPENVEKPVISSAGSDASPVIYFGFISDKENKRDIDTYLTYLNNEIKEQFERLEGVASIFIPGGTHEQLHIKLSPQKLASHGLSIDNVARIIRAENTDTAAGTIDIDRRTYRIRTVARFKSIEDIEQIVIVNDGQKNLLLKDIAEVGIGYEKVTASIFNASGADLEKSLVYGIRIRPDANIVDTTNRVEEVVTHLNNEVLPKKNIHIKWFYDQRAYINGSIETVKKNILIGGIFATVILLLFLRSILPTVVVSLSIPISVIATFSTLYLMDRTLNTISLAGISFAIGMLLDAAIVVLENIDRHMKMGKTAIAAAHDGTTEVWGALVASALTTIAVFVPIIFLDSEAAQLFKDIAISVTAAITFSLFVSIAAIPMFWTQLFKHYNINKQNELKTHSLYLFTVGTIISSRIMLIVKWSLKNKRHQFTTILLIASLSVTTIWYLFPKMEYLPQGNQNLIMNILIPPPGLSQKERDEIGFKLHEYIKPHFNQQINGIPEVRNTWYVSLGDVMLQGMISDEEERAAEYIPFMLPKINSFPGIFGLSLQRGVFEQGVGEGRNIDVDISGKDLNKLTQIGGTLYGAISQEIPNAQIRPIPSIEILFPEAQIIPNRYALSSVGLDSSRFGFAIDVLLDGRKIGEYAKDEQKSIDMILTSSKNSIDTPEEL